MSLIRIHCEDDTDSSINVTSCIGHLTYFLFAADEHCFYKCSGGTMKNMNNEWLVYSFQQKRHFSQLPTVHLLTVRA